METGPLLPKTRAGEPSWPNAPFLSISTPPTPFVGDLPALLSHEVQARHPGTDLPMPTLSLPILALGELAKGRDLVLVVSGPGPSIEFVPLRRSANTCWDKMTVLGGAAGLGGVE